MVMAFSDGKMEYEVVLADKRFQPKVWLDPLPNLGMGSIFPVIPTVKSLPEHPTPSEEPISVCEKCNRKFIFRSSLLRHRKVKACEPAKKPIECRTCGDTFSHVCVRDNVIKSRLSADKCAGCVYDPRCGPRRVKSVIPEQVKTAAVPRRENGHVSCELLCGKFFARRQGVRRHLKNNCCKVLQEGRKTKATCPLCEKTFARKRDLRDHILYNKKHKAKKEMSLKTAIRELPSDEIDCKPGTSSQVFEERDATWVCKYCPKRFNTRSELNEHELLHTGVKPHKCDNCAASFAKPARLLQHGRRCSRPQSSVGFQCDWCEREFRRQSDLTHHRNRFCAKKPPNFKAVVKLEPKNEVRSLKGSRLKMRVSQLAGVRRRAADVQGCLLCGSKESIELDEEGRLSAGALTEFPLPTGGSFQLHALCALFDSNLKTYDSQPDDNYFGFSLIELFAEHRRGSRLACTLCKKDQALLGCWEKGCPLKMHLACAFQSGATFHEFYGSFRTFCVKHWLSQPKSSSVPGRLFSVSHVRAPVYVDTCFCGDAVAARAGMGVVKTQCCRHHRNRRIPRWYHKTCLQNYALQAGWYQLRCPHCEDGKLEHTDGVEPPDVNDMLPHLNKDGFRASLLHQGIYIPQRDSTWETEEGAFDEQNVRVCDAPTCRCPHASTQTQVVEQLHARFMDDASRKEPAYLASLPNRIYADLCPNKDLPSQEDERTVPCLPWELVGCDACGQDERHIGCRETTHKTCQLYVCEQCEAVGREAVVMETEVVEDGEEVVMEAPPLVREAGEELATGWRPRMNTPGPYTPPPPLVREAGEEIEDGEEIGDGEEILACWTSDEDDDARMAAALEMLECFSEAEDGTGAGDGEDLLDHWSEDESTATSDSGEVEIVAEFQHITVSDDDGEAKEEEEEEESAESEQDPNAIVEEPLSDEEVECVSLE